LFENRGRLADFRDTEENQRHIRMGLYAAVCVIDVDLGFAQARCYARDLAGFVRKFDLNDFSLGVRAGCAGIVPRGCDGPRLAYLILRDLGVIPSREAMLNLEKVTPQATSAEDRAARQTRLLASVIAERHRVFGIELPDDMKAAIGQGDAAEVEMPRRSLRV
jgi:hypothetical protein